MNPNMFNFSNANNPQINDEYTFENARDMNSFSKYCSQQFGVADISQVSKQTLSVTCRDENTASTIRSYYGESVVNENGNDPDHDCEAVHPGMSHEKWESHHKHNEDKEEIEEVGYMGNHPTVGGERRTGPTKAKQIEIERKKKELRHKRERLARERERIDDNVQWDSGDFISKVVEKINDNPDGTTPFTK